MEEATNRLDCCITNNGETNQQQVFGKVPDIDIFEQQWETDTYRQYVGRKNQDTLRPTSAWSFYSKLSVFEHPDFEPCPDGRQLFQHEWEYLLCWGRAFWTEFGSLI